MVPILKLKDSMKVFLSDSFKFLFRFLPSSQIALLFLVLAVNIQLIIMLSKHKNIRKQISHFTKKKPRLSKTLRQKMLGGKSADNLSSNPLPSVTGTYYIIAGYPDKSQQFSPYSYFQFEAYSDPNTFQKYLKLIPLTDPTKYETDNQYKLTLNGSEDNDGLWTTRVTSQLIDGVLGVKQHVQPPVKVDIYPLTQTDIVTTFAFTKIITSQFPLGDPYQGAVDYGDGIKLYPLQYDPINKDILTGQSYQTAYFWFIKVPTQPIPQPKPVPGPLPPLPDGNTPIDPVNYGLYAIRNNWCQRYINYSVSNHKVILAENPILFEPKIVTDGYFYLHCPQFTSYLFVTNDHEIQLSPQPETLFSFITPTAPHDPGKYTVHVKDLDLNLNAKDYSNLNLDPGASYQTVFQFLISLPKPVPEPPTNSFNLEPIQNQYYKPFTQNTNGQYDFYNCGPPIQLYPGDKATVPLGHKQGSKVRKTLKMLLKPRQYHFSKSILGRLIHIGKEGTDYTIDLLNGGKKKETIHTGQPCAQGLLQDAAQDVQVVADVAKKYMI